MNTKMDRQGDVGILPVTSDSIPSNATPVAKDNGRTILAYGEVTGHAHAVTSEGDVSLYEVIVPGDVAEMRDRFLSVEKESTITHEEHGTIVLTPGVYKIIRQREYEPEGYRYVAD